MKIIICGDVHWSQYSSILKKRGRQYSIRLENLINSLNWVNEVATERDCSACFYLGDFFDRSGLNAEELSALSQITWNEQIKHYFLCGNHEMASIDHLYSSAKFFSSFPACQVIDGPQKLVLDSCQVFLLPYITEAERLPLSDYFKRELEAKTILLSHNDIAGIQLGLFKSLTGFEVSDLSQSADLVFNGHLHNGTAVAENVINVGNLTGQNFSEDAYKYSHKIAILDTDTLEVSYLENPFAFNFYKIEILEKKDFNKLVSLKNQAVVSFKCEESLIDALRSEIELQKNIVEARVIISKSLTTSESNTVDISELAVDHLTKFITCCKEKIDNSEILEQELLEICN